MFIHETSDAKAAKKTVILMAVLFALFAAFGALLTMHIYVKRSPLVAPGWRIFGFPRAR
jgi:hypothetical protein